MTLTQKYTSHHLFSVCVFFFLAPNNEISVSSCHNTVLNAVN